MEIEIPNWLTKEFIKQALDGDKDCGITVDNIEVDKPVAKGENYMCEIFRVKVDYRKLTGGLLKTSLIVKVPIVGPMYDILLKMGIIQKEVNVYNEYLPKVDDLLGDRNTLTPKTYHSEQENVLVLEDLKFEGYAMAERQQQLDFDHSVIALKTLALYHAVSVKLHDKDPKFVERIGEEVFFKETLKETEFEFAKLQFSLMAEASKMVPELTRYGNQFLKLSKTSWKTLIQIVSPKENSFNVLNHGDFWVNNMLFRYENDKPVSVKLIDLQGTRYSTPAIDLLHFLYSSILEEVRQKRTEDLLRIYLDELNHHLEKFNTTQRLTESDLKLTMDTSELYGLFVSVSLFPLVIADPKEGVLDMKEVKFEDFKDVTSNLFSHFFRNRRLIETLVTRLAEFEKKGWL